ncbi:MULTISPECIES: ATP-dependent DNA ligase [unclassified Streptomyces]|uniref:ATP-dependent DNA ligase n=1 Tax=unclassified Streptomyces TaxID=2593676 RepID=UPI00094000D4|nr:ATP-dependent DNA ligase [Streptomyces sp. CB02058]OKI92779.1 ATP-dependent DNA ligase [Streptomyces sp. CB02058]
MLLARLAHVSLEVAATSARTRKTALLAELFREAGPDDVPVVIPYLAGRLPQGRLGIGWSTLRVPVTPAEEPTLTVVETHTELTAIGALTGPGSQSARKERLAGLLGAATADEQYFLRGLLTGEVRQGALDAVAVDALADAAGAARPEVRRAVMLAGSLAPVARAVLAEGPGVLASFRLTVGRPVQPMLAHTARSVAEAIDRLGPCAVEEKLDGIRVQVHRDGPHVRVYTRTLDDISDRLPELAAAVTGFPAGRFVLDGEAIALGPDGRPRPFQETAGRVGSRRDVVTAADAVPVVPVFFDVLSVDGRELLDLPLTERHRELAGLVPEPMRVRRVTVEDPGDDAQRTAALEFAEATLARGHEGVVVKGAEAAYSAGRRGASWLKVKPVHTLDLVVLAAEWGHGRRTGKLSNLHLGARREDGTFAMLGKTFKGLTDAMLSWQTERLRELSTGDDGHVVTVRPELVVEIGYDGLQTSTRYPAGVTLRFARVLRYREDKRADEADTVGTVLSRRT